MPESWRPVPGYEGLYDVSDLGRVRSRGRHVGAKGGSKRWNAERILSPGRLEDGHLTVSLRKDGSGRSHGVHRLVLLAFVGPAPADTEGCHGNGDPADNRLINLRWDTRASNVRDQVLHGAHHMSRRTHCKNNHALTEPNVYRYGNARVCKTCIAQNARNRKVSA